MKFTGFGFVFCAKKKRTIVSFNKVKEYETHDEDEIESLLDNPNVQCIERAIDEMQPEEIKIKGTELESENTEMVADTQLTNQEMKDLLDGADIEYRKKATKAELEELLKGI